MYQNVGLKTPRGSGTSGYVQKNVSFVKPSGRKNYGGDGDEQRLTRPEALPARKPGRDVQEHLARRAIELELLDFREAWQAAHPDASAEDLDAKVGRQRAYLLQQLATQTDADSADFKSNDDDDDRGSILLNKDRKDEELQRMRQAFGIGADAQEGSAFRFGDSMTDAERRQERQQQFEERERQAFYAGRH